MDPKSQRVKLNDGHFTPVLGFGTYAPEELWCNSLQPELVRPALEKSLQNLQLDYVDLYIIHSPVSLKPGNKFVPKDESGKLIFDSVDLCQTWEALEKCKDAGLTKSIGVSNFNHKQLEKILNKPGLKYKPVCNQPARLLCPWHSPDKNTGVDCHALLQGIFLTQGSNLHLSHWQGGSLQLAPPGKPPHLFLQDRVECHPYLNQSKLLEFCKSHDIVLVAYAALGAQLLSEWVNSNNPVLLEDTVLCAIAKKHKQTPALVALRYQIQRGVVVLAKSFNKKRIKENMQVFDFELTPEDMKAIDGLNRNIRYYDFQQGIGHPEYPFSEEY
ncbi:dihydrodiol dehydrogenase 3 isoform X2 [Bubalus bubalis]|uniref:dihydrodiol dehydrogenase 3 isoform X2 n=1 Tax=Bubalus bubalis TaxID=89462 RepID=UPI001E1B67E7|nr:dihydrodiol dehydrogenase 3 isoform X2 [Bubalus bubalis]